jgi:hypothetical protein
MTINKTVLLLFSFSFTLLSFSGCFVVKKLAGADVDLEQFAKAREAKVLEVQLAAAQSLSQRLGRGGPLENADLVFYMNQELVNKAAKQIVGTTGWLDSTTSYIVQSVNVILYNGSAIASLGLLAHSNSYGMDVQLTMDCSLSFRIENTELVALIEPFNIAPVVKATGLLSSFEEIIRNIIALRVGNMSKDFPPMKFPIDFTSQVKMDGTATNIAAKLNMQVLNPQRLIRYRLTLKEFLVFSGKAFFALNITNVEAK